MGLHDDMDKKVGLKGHMISRQDRFIIILVDLGYLFEKDSTRQIFVTIITLPVYYYSHISFTQYIINYEKFV